MNNFNFQDCRKAVNQASFRPTAERKALAVKLLAEALDFVNNLEEVKESSKKTTKKRRRKTTKSTPSQKVADRQERQFHGKADGAVTPSKKGAKKASVEEARKSAEAVSEATGAAQRAAKKAELKAEALKKEAVLPQPKVDNEVNDKIASLEAKIETLTQCLAVAMESMIPASSSPANEVSIDELPF